MEKEKEKEESQSWKAEDLLEFMNYPDDESDHPNVLTEEVTNDKKMLDQQISVDLTPCSEHHGYCELDDDVNHLTRGF